PNTMLVKWLDQPTQIYRTGTGPMGEDAAAHTRTPAGHPEGYLEAFANIYRNFAHTVNAKIEGKQPDKQHLDFPTIADGVRRMKIIEAVIESMNNNAKWTEIA